MNLKKRGNNTLLFVKDDKFKNFKISIAFKTPLLIASPASKEDKLPFNASIATNIFIIIPLLPGTLPLFSVLPHDFPP